MPWNMLRAPIFAIVIGIDEKWFQEPGQKNHIRFVVSPFRGLWSPEIVVLIPARIKASAAGRFWTRYPACGQLTVYRLASEEAVTHASTEATVAIPGAKNPISATHRSFEEGGMDGIENRFTLMEVLIALAVAAIAAMGIFRLQVIGLEAAMYSDLASRAAVIAESRMEEALAYAQAYNEAPEPDGGTIAVEEMQTQFHWELEVMEAEVDIDQLDGELPNLWRMVCRVRWGGDGAEKSIELERYAWGHYFDR